MEYKHVRMTGLDNQVLMVYSAEEAVRVGMLNNNDGLIANGLACRMWNDEQIEIEITDKGE